MLIVPGPAAASQFRIDKKLAELATFLPDLRNIRSRFAHILELDAPLGGHEQARLGELLAYGRLGLSLDRAKHPVS